MLSRGATWFDRHRWRILIAMAVLLALGAGAVSTVRQIRRDLASDMELAVLR